jgi:hypothetical protein
MVKPKQSEPPDNSASYPQVDDATIPLGDDLENVPEAFEVRHTLLMPDSPTILLKSSTTKNAARTAPDFRQRILRALNKRKPLHPNKRTTSTMRAVKTDAQPSDRAVSPTMSDDPINTAYVMNRLNRGIYEAQENKNFKEAIRLQFLMWKMQDGEISPVEVARKAWLRPALEKAVPKPSR